MKRKYVVVVVCFVISLCLLIVYYVFNQWIINSYDGSTFSNSKTQSQTDNYFIGDYFPERTHIILNNKIIESPNIWIESAQETDHDFLFIPTKEKSNRGYNLIIDSHLSCASKGFQFSINKSYHVLNCIDSLGWIYLIPVYYDEIVLYLSRPDDNLGWQKEIIIDSLKYRRPISKDAYEKVFSLHPPH